MKMKIKRGIAVLLLLIIALTAAACSGEKEKESESTAALTVAAFSPSALTPSEALSVGEALSSLYAAGSTFAASSAKTTAALTESSAKTTSVSSTTQTAKTTLKKTSAPTTAAPTRSVMKAVWITCYEMAKYTKSGSASEFSRLVAADFAFLKKNSINTVIVHVRPFSDAFYKSKIFPMSKYSQSSDGKKPSYDPLALLIKEADKKGLSVHAWINPYRVSYSNDVTALDAACPARKWLEDSDKTNDSAVTVFSGGIFYSPNSTQAQKLIISGVREIVSSYAVDAIHIDDYFYPTQDAAFDKTAYSAYCAEGGKLSLAAWRRENVNSLLLGINSAIKSIKPSVKFGISPAGGIEEDKNKHYADVALWAKNKSYCDYLMPQLYYGFLNEKHPFEKSVSEWAALCTNSSVKLYAGLAAYKTGQADEYAGSSPEAANEWKNDSTVIKRQTAAILASKRFSGYSFFSIGDLNKIFR